MHLVAVVALWLPLAVMAELPQTPGVLRLQLAVEGAV